MIEWHTQSIVSLKTLKIIVRTDLPSSAKIPLFEELLGREKPYKTFVNTLEHANWTMIFYLTACYKKESPTEFLEFLKQRMLSQVAEPGNLHRSEPYEPNAEQKQNFYQWYVDEVNIDSYTENGTKTFSEILTSFETPDDLRNESIADLCFVIDMYLKVLRKDVPVEEKVVLLDNEFQAIHQLCIGLVAALTQVFNTSTEEALDSLIEKVQETLEREQAKLA